MIVMNKKKIEKVSDEEMAEAFYLTKGIPFYLNLYFIVFSSFIFSLIVVFLIWHYGF